MYKKAYYFLISRFRPPLKLWRVPETIENHEKCFSSMELNSVAESITGTTRNLSQNFQRNWIIRSRFKKNFFFFLSTGLNGSNSTANINKIISQTSSNNPKRWNFFVYIFMLVLDRYPTETIRSNRKNFNLSPVLCIEGQTGFSSGRSKTLCIIPSSLLKRYWVIFFILLHSYNM